MKHHPHEVETHLAIAVDEAVAHARDLAPGNFRMRGLRDGGNLARRLAENLQCSNGRVLVQPARKKSRFVEPFDKFLGIARREQHVEKKRRVSFGQFNHRRFRPLSGSPGGE
jgi:hypothetical protein